jgi:transposase
MAAWRQILALTIEDEDLARLTAIARSRTEPAGRVERARMLLGYREDPSFFAVGRALGVHHQTVQRCVERAVAYGPLPALEDRPRPGKEPKITAEAKAWLVDLACRKAKELGYPHELWTTRLLARHAREHGPAAGHDCLASLVQGTVCKILNRQEIKPHKVRYYLERRDAEFEDKMAEVLCVYGEVGNPAEGCCRWLDKANRGGGGHLLRREARHPGDRNDGAGPAAQARCARDLCARL